MERGRGNTGSSLVLLVDIISIGIAYFLAAWIRGGIIQPDFLTTMYGITFIITVLSYMVLYQTGDSRYNIFKRSFYEEFVVVIKEQTKLCLIVMTYLFVTQQGKEHSRMFLMLFFLLNFIITYIVRGYVKVYMLIGYKRSKFSSKIMLVTLATRAEKTIRKIRKEYNWKFLVNSIAIMDEDMVGTKVMGIKVIANHDNILEMARLNVVDEVLIHLPSENDMNLEEIILELEKMGIIVHLTLDISNNINIKEKRVESFAGQQVITFSTRMFNEGQVFLKRMLDILGGLVGIIFTGIITIILTPILLIESRGPIFFSQIRIGKNGRQFKIYKFRSMYKDAEQRKQELMDKNEMKGHMFKMTDDPRITKVGKFIRRTSIDEFPQFINVLKGDMSLVGTRPPTLDEFNHYESRHKRRLSLKPGLTGLWQVSGRSDIQDFEEVVRLDLEYIDNWSLGLDLKLIVKTLHVVMFGRGSR